MERTALILVDMQNEYFAGGGIALEGMEKAAENASRLLSFFREKEMALFHVQHISIRPDSKFFVPETHGAEINEKVFPLEGEDIIVKHFPNCFRDTNLNSQLRNKHIDTLVICGAMSHMCIDTTVRAAFDLGFSCIVAEDACATRNLSFKDLDIPANLVQGTIMSSLGAAFAEILSTLEILDRYEKKQDIH
ncbi:MAG TPA: cysteine hydrolase family protein [Synergistales bacterium]|nr:cysteine hydrolase family protein [Synergistales bacterium]